MLTTLAAAIAVALLFLLWSGKGPLRHSPWPAVVVLGLYAFHLIDGAALNVRAPREWDYACFWLYGHIAAVHQNVYDPAALARFPAPFTFSDVFRDDVLNVGFPYPPPSIVLFLPLGFIDNVPLGLTLWYVAQFAALGAAAWSLARTFMPAAGRHSVIFVLAVIAALPASQMNVNTAQTNFLLLLLVALALRGRNTPAGAIWTTLAIWVKPYAAVLLLLDLIRGHRKRLIVAAATLVASLLAAVVVLGPATFASYLRGNPAAREPAAAYAEFLNQSLLAVVLRLHSALPEQVSVLHEPLYLILALILGGLTVALCLRAPAGGDAAFALMLLLGLIVYPGTLSSYGVISIVPFLVLWRHRGAFPGRSVVVAPLIAVAVALQSGWGQRGFEANVLMWIACAYVLLAARSPVRDEAPMPAKPARAGTAAVAR
jgi:hypothetical protein